MGTSFYSSSLNLANLTSTATKQSQIFSKNNENFVLQQNLTNFKAPKFESSKNENQIRFINRLTEKPCFSQTRFLSKQFILIRFHKTFNRFEKLLKIITKFPFLLSELQ